MAALDSISIVSTLGTALGVPANGVVRLVSRGVLVTSFSQDLENIVVVYQRYCPSVPTYIAWEGNNAWLQGHS